MALCVDADLETESRRPAGAGTPSSSSSPVSATTAGVNGNGQRKRINGGGGETHGVSGGPAALPEVGPMHVSFRGLFEAFGAALEGASPSRSGRFGGGGGGGGANGGVGRTAAGAGAPGAGREAVALLLYSLLQANSGFLRAAVVRSDADALLLPLLRTLHNCGSASGGGGGKSASKAAKSSEVSAVAGQEQQKLRQQQQQSPAALYVPAIVVLLFSQDAAFNRQAFRQVGWLEVFFFFLENPTRCSGTPTVFAVGNIPSRCVI